MDFHRYAEQVKGLRRYAAAAEIPADPYDVPVFLARRLLDYQRQIRLSPDEQKTYDRAVKRSAGGGPCCCRCWRWSAFEGQAKFLIARRGYGSDRVAEVWELEDGCGGSAHAHA